LIGLSPLSTAHRSNFQLTTVRSSTKCYLRFNLAMDRSTGFGSNSCNYTRYSHSVSLRLHLTRLNLAAKIDSPTHDAKGTRSNWSEDIVLPPIVDIRFQGLFHSPRRGTFHLSLTVLFTIGHKQYLGLEDGPPRFKQDFSCPALLRIPVRLSTLSCTGISPSMSLLSRSFH